MAVTQAKALLFAAAIMAIFALIGTAAAQEAPAPAPASAAGVASPSIAVACAVSVASVVFGSALKM